MPLFTTPGTAITAGTITETQFSNTVDFGGPKISSILVTNSSYVATGSNTVSTAGGYIKAIGTGFVTGCTVVVNSNIASSVSFVNSTEVRAQLPATVDGTYMMYLTNPDGGVALRLNAITYLTPDTIIDYLVIAGGGGGGYAYGGGGGAGGLLSSTGLTITGAVTLTILVGAGGAPDTDGANSSISGSGISTITAIGGGGGRVNTNSGSGGSGGGASNAMFGSTGNKGLGTAGPPRQGYDGGDGGYYYGGGGGGAGAVGSSSGTGGIGANSSITGSSVTYAGGGGGGAQSRYGGSGSSSGFPRQAGPQESVAGTAGCAVGLLREVRNRVPSDLPTRRDQRLAGAISRWEAL